MNARWVEWTLEQMRRNYPEKFETGERKLAKYLTKLDLEYVEKEFAKNIEEEWGVEYFPSQEYTYCKKNIKITFENNEIATRESDGELGKYQWNTKKIVAYYIHDYIYDIAWNFLERLKK